MITTNYLWILAGSWLLQLAVGQHYDLHAARRAPAGPNSPILAYDCSHPTHVFDTTHAEPSACDLQHHKVERTRNVTYQILQKTQSRTATGFLCRKTVSRSVYYCGVYDHMTVRPDLQFVAQHRTITNEDCEELWTSGTHRDPVGRKHPVDHNSVLYYAYYARGHTWTQNGESKCQGEKWSVNGEIMDDMVVLYEVALEVTEEKFRESAEDLTTVALTNKRQLPCPFSRGRCLTSRGTYQWTVDPNYCPLALTRTVTGVEVCDEEGINTFMSTDGSMVRLILGPKEAECGRPVTTTNYPDLRVYRASNQRPFTETVQPEDMSIVTFVNNQDDYLYSHLLDQIERELNLVRAHDCRAKKQETRKDYYLQHAIPGIMTYSMGNGTFALSAGEVLYYYRCQPLVVTAVSLPQCYDALPVTSPGLGQRSEQHFLEPLTHRLHKVATNLECSSTFRTKYRAMNGVWLMATPDIHVAPAPAVPRDHAGRIHQWDRSLNFSTGGIYTRAELRRMERYTELGHVAQVLTTRLATNANLPPQGPLDPEHLFAHLPAYENPFSRYWQNVVKGLDIWGRYAAIAISVYTIGRILYNGGMFVYNYLLLREVVGICRALIETCFPDVHHAKMRRDHFRARRAPSGDAETAPLQGRVSKAEDPEDKNEEDGRSVAEAPPPFKSVERLLAASRIRRLRGDPRPSKIVYPATHGDEF